MLDAVPLLLIQAHRRHGPITRALVAAPQNVRDSDRTHHKGRPTTRVVKAAASPACLGGELASSPFHVQTRHFVRYQWLSANVLASPLVSLLLDPERFHVELCVHCYRPAQPAIADSPARPGRAETLSCVRPAQSVQTLPLAADDLSTLFAIWRYRASERLKRGSAEEREALPLTICRCFVPVIAWPP